MAEPDPKRRKTAATSTQTNRTTRPFDKADCVTLVIGPERNEMLVHVHYLVQESEAFRNAFTEDCIARTMIIPHVDYDTMTNYIAFAYIKELPTAHLVGPRCDAVSGEEYATSARLYVLGDQFQNQSLKRATLGEIKRISTLLDIDTNATFPSPEAIDIIYKGTSKGDPARRLMVDMLAENADGSWLRPECNQTFILDLARELLNKSRGTAPSSAPAHLV